MIRGPLLACALLPVCILLTTGCSDPHTASAPVSSAPASNVSPLAGNWLLYGSMPREGLGSASAQGLALDIQVTGNQILASANLQGMCSATSGFGVVYSQVLTGNIAADGTFTISSPGQATLAGLTVKGTVPNTNGGSWPGTYTAAFTGLSCTTPLTGAFTATPVAQVNGTFTGSGSMRAPLPATAILPVSASVSLQQGAQVYSYAVPVSSSLLLSGSIKVQGFSCFTTGVSSPTGASLMEGNRVAATFTMDDGSRLELLGDLTDTAADQIAVNVLSVSGGACAGLYTAPLTPLVLNR